jgi:hypothetical protein
MKRKAKKDRYRIRKKRKKIISHVIHIAMAVTVKKEKKKKDGVEKFITKSI